MRFRASRYKKRKSCLSVGHNIFGRAQQEIIDTPAPAKQRRSVGMHLGF